MKDIYKNPLFYYIAVPAVLAVWLLTISAVSLPNAKKQWKKEFSQYNKAAKVMEKILKTDPERVNFASQNNGSDQFDYATAIEKIASKSGISSTSYNFSSGKTVKSGDQKSQDGKLNVKDVSLVKFANFLSSIQFRWSELQCVKIKLTKKKKSPDLWDVDVSFKYYF